MIGVWDAKEFGASLKKEVVCFFRNIVTHLTDYTAS
jgi:hypothetical protein